MRFCFNAPEPSSAAVHNETQLRKIVSCFMLDGVLNSHVNEPFHYNREGDVVQVTLNGRLIGVLDQFSEADKWPIVNLKSQDENYV